MIEIDEDDMDKALQDLIVKFYPEAELKEENTFIFDRYQDIKFQLVDLILDMGEEQQNAT
jgi:hypothetical protein|tara:strand:- start:559 stop:738 length:180 start_codon:yes stop_codon:yes gene_type:complete